MAIYPDDYAKLKITPAALNFTEGMKARRIMVKWIHSLKDPGVKIENRRKG
jgi:hypothetical protein